MERLACIARAEILNLSQCEGEVAMRRLSDQTSAPLCDKHTELYDVVDVLESAPQAPTPQNSQQ